MNAAPNLNLFRAGLVIEECIRQGVDHFFIAPGSRSSPLALAVAQHPRAFSVVHFDERGLAFAALGFARAKGVPGVVITTSGSAAANLFPAVTEASQSCVPMLILTADRPPELRDTAANQTMDQVKLFGGFVRWYADVPCPSLEVPAESLLTTIDQAVFRACADPSGPVHLNMMFRDPLSTDRDGVNTRPERKRLASWWSSGHALTTYDMADEAPDPATVRETCELLQRAKRGLLVVGELRDDASRLAVSRFAVRLGWPVIADITSGLDTTTTPLLVDHPDLVFLSERFAGKHAADTVFHVGGRLSSKRVVQGLETMRPRISILWNNHPFRQDATHSLTHRAQVSIAPALRSLSKALKPTKNASWSRNWIKAGATVEKVLTETLDADNMISEPGVARLLHRMCADRMPLHLASSMPVRDADMYASRKVSPWISASRGVSGIDGTIATATGFAIGAGGPATVLVGDLAALHDLNSLAMLKAPTPPVTLVVINNDGGGIFSFLPVSKSGAPFERFFGTPHGLGFKSAAQLFGVSYSTPQTMKGLEDILANWWDNGKTGVIEVLTKRDENHATHQLLNKAIRAALDR